MSAPPAVTEERSIVAWTSARDTTPDGVEPIRLRAIETPIDAPTPAKPDADAGRGA